MSDSMERTALALSEEMLEQPQEEQEQWLRERCGENQPLFERVQRLLAHIPPTQFSPKIQSVEGEDHSAEEPPPEQLGAYRLLGLIGRGGMGAVYKGERADGAFERTVAIKLVGAIRARSDAERRFTNERQILARMKHANIAQLLDGGTVDGRGYLVMEYVEGERFDHKEERSLDATLSAFRKVCAAVQYAHSNLVLHRDIKPDNVLLDKTGEPKLLDFGIAKLSQEVAEPASADVTGTKAAPLTLNYSAPERLLGEPATVSSDVYSLGVYLYVLLHGVRPYDLTGKTLPEAWKQLRERTARDAPTDFGDVGLIAEKAMQSDIGARYASAAELAVDVQRFQNRQTVSARAPHWRYTFNSFVARNKAAVSAGVLGLVVLFSAFVMTALAYVESQRQTQIATEEATTSGQAVDFLRKVLSTANPMVSNDKDLTVAEVLAFAKDRLAGGDIENPAARAYIESALAFAHDGRGEFETALNYAEASVDRLDQNNIQSANQRDALYTYALALVHSDKPEPAIEVLERLLSEARIADEEQSWMVVEAETLLGNAQENTADEEAALISYRSALDRAALIPSDNPEANIVLLNNYGGLLHKQGDYDGAMNRYQQSLELTSQLDNSELRQAVLLANMGGVYGDQQQWPKAIQLLQSGLELHAAANNLSGPNALISRTTLANFQRQSGDVEGASKTIAAALTSVETALPEDHFITAYIQNVAAVTYCDTDQWSDGLEYARRSLATRTKLMPAGHWMLASGKSVLGKCETRAGNYARARTLLMEALQSLTELRGEEGTQTRQTQQRLDELAAATGQ